MASRVMHLAAAVHLLEMLPVGMDVPRFLSGTIMVNSAPQERRASHFLTQHHGRRTYDIARFRSLYGCHMLSDGLVLGYYLHLLQDLVFRRYMYGELGFDPRRPGYLAGLHSDYRRLNRLLIRRYRLTTDFVIPISAEPLQSIAAFDMPGLQGALAEDFALLGEPEAFFFTEEMAVRYVEQAVDKCRKELVALKDGLALTDPMEWTWNADPV